MSIGGATGQDIGSSPRARGTLPRRDFASSAHRFIPAGAGNTSVDPLVGRRQTVHPRGRGEHGDVGIAQLNPSGSSPRARGTRWPNVTRPRRHRFIPAGAGNTTDISSFGQANSVHPRGRGEHIDLHAARLPGIGSSPRARGTLPANSIACASRRFIPAGAGNTSTLRSAQICTTVHPRGRGEHAKGFIPHSAACGSSPRARGTPRHDLNGPVRHRFIPAGAGNTGSRANPGTISTVHPRGRGEHAELTFKDGIGFGSSPRARGTQIAGWRGQRLCRFIPAGAGNTLVAISDSRARAVHPRGRGEHLRLDVIETGIIGSSPRARGTLSRSGRVSTLPRFIPAGAGNTRFCPCGP